MTLEAWMLDLVLLGIAAEFALLAVVLVRRGFGGWAWPLLWFLCSGALLMGAVRGLLSGLSPVAVGGILLASLFTHVACLASTWRLVQQRV